MSDLCSVPRLADIDDSSCDSGIDCGSQRFSPRQPLCSPAVKLTPVRRIDFADLLSPTDTVRLIY